MYVVWRVLRWRHLAVVDVGVVYEKIATSEGSRFVETRREMDVEWSNLRDVALLPTF